jgi:hypothetical protein
MAITHLAFLTASSELALRLTGSKVLASSNTGPTGHRLRCALLAAYVEPAFIFIQKPQQNSEDGQGGVEVWPRALLQRYGYSTA